MLFAEVQQTSDATFRLFDWNRVGTDGKPRQLHKDEALAAIDWSRGPVEPIPGTSTSPQGRGADVKKLVDCDYFVMTRYDVRHELTPAASDSFEVWMVLGGEGILCTEDGGYRRAFTRGETVLVPAACGNVVWQSTSAAPFRLLRVCAR